jgi:cation diffusion facilitator CzcD-associated flavoprotein CzcO
VTDSLQASAPAVEDPGKAVEQFDAIVVGAGLSGLYQLYSLRQAGLSVRCFEEGSGVGGTWYWNRYPGSGFDSPSATYGFTFSEELVREWSWTHYFAYRPEAEAYLNFVADKLDLRSHIQLSSRVTAARWDEEDHLWEIELDSGERVRAAFFFPMLGTFSSGYTPQFEGAECFQGESYHPSRWPREDPDFTGKRVAVIGTGATGMQMIPHIAARCGRLTVFQRTPNYSMPADNAPMDPGEQQALKDDPAEITKRLRENFGYPSPDPRNALDVPKEERLELYEETWKRRGFDRFMALFHDMFNHREILEEYSEFVKGKIRARVTDPVLAEKLVPNDHVIHSKRVPLETNYYETFNRDNVELVDLRETPIERLSETGIETREREFELDIIIYATGFDSVTGPFRTVDIRGVGGQSLKDMFDQNGVCSYLGYTITGFPNLFTHTLPTVGVRSRGDHAAPAPESPAKRPGSGAAHREWSHDWFTDCIQFMRTHGYTRIEATQEAQDAWDRHVEEMAKGAVFGDAEYTWYVGSNIPGKKRQLLLYMNSSEALRAKCYEVSENGYAGFDLG